MAMIVNEPTFGGRLGEAMGTGLSQGLQLLAQHKLNQVTERHQQSQKEAGLKALMPNASAEQIRNYAKFPDSLLSLVIKNELARPSEESFADLLGMGQKMPASTEEVSPEEAQMNQYSQQLGLNQTPSSQMQANLAGLFGGQSPVQQAALLQQPIQPQGVPVQSGIKTPGVKPRLTQKQFEVLEKRRAEEEKLRSGAFKQTAGFRKEMIDLGKSSRTHLQDYEEMDRLQEEGLLDTPGYMEFLKRSGFDIPALMKPGSEEFEKIRIGFLRDAKQFFGARISNFELESFLKSIPSLSQSPEGRKRVIANLKRMARAGLEYSKTTREIMAKNKGIPPLDIMEQVEDVMEKKLDAISKQFRADLKKPVPKGQNKIITALQAGLGEIAGGITGLLRLPSKVGSLVGGKGASIPEE